MTKTDIFLSDWASPPGDTILELLEEQSLSLSDFAQLMHQDTDAISDLIHGRTEINGETAAQLEGVFGNSRAFWAARENQYRQAIYRIQACQAAESGAGWLNELPTSDLVKFGWITAGDSKREKLIECLRFFGAPNVEEWRKTYDKITQITAFKTSPSFDSQPGAVASWLRQSELEADKIDCISWDADAFRQALTHVRALTRKRDPKIFLPDLKSICAASGVAFVVVRAPSGCRASGASRFISKHKAILSLSFRYLSDDHFWFTFFHEAAHLLLHQHDRLFLEWDGIPADKEESEANDFAADILIPHRFRPQLMALPLDGRAVIRFSREVGVSPGIVVGQLQHLGRFKRNQLNNLKTRFSWDGD